MTGFRAMVTGMGMITPAGYGVEANWVFARAGRSTAAADPALAGLPVEFSCRVPDFDPTTVFGARQARNLDRHVQFAVLAAREAVATAALSTVDPARVAVVLGTGAGGVAALENQQSRLDRSGAHKVSAMTLPMGLPNMAAAQIAIEFGFRGPNLVVSTACASGATAIGTARDLLRVGAADVVITGGAEAAITPLFVSAFARMGALSMRHDDPATACRPFDVTRDGFVIGEGAGVLVLESEQHARARGARTYGGVSGYGASSDAHHVSKPDPAGTAPEEALLASLRDAGADATEIGYVNAHGTSTQLNDRTEAAVIKRVLGGTVPVSSTKSVTGHTLGAAGAVEAIFSLLALEHGVLPPTGNLTDVDPVIELDIVREVGRSSHARFAVSNSFGFGGQNAVLVLFKN